MYRYKAVIIWGRDSISVCLRGTTSERLHNWCTAGEERSVAYISSSVCNNYKEMQRDMKNTPEQGKTRGGKDNFQWRNSDIRRAFYVTP